MTKLVCTYTIWASTSSLITMYDIIKSKRKGKLVTTQ